MAVTSSCRSCLAPLAALESDRTGVIGSSRMGAPSTSLPSVPEAPSPASERQGKLSSADVSAPSPPSRWMSRAVLTAAAAATLSLTSSIPVVHALEQGLTLYKTPGNMSISIAIPIPDPDQWVFSENGFIAALPGKEMRSEESQYMTFDGGCPAWHPTEFERVVPDHAHAKPYPRKGNQWPASLSAAEDGAFLQILAHGGEDVSDADASFLTRYPSLEVVLTGVPSLDGIGCFNL